jgi:uncharacterized repeat protein (TIGR03837 family)
MDTTSERWDIFCKVVDNFGDIGVAWRLARILAAEHGLAVRLWVDDLASLARIWPAVAPDEPVQQAAGVEVRHWTVPFPAVDPADVVIETFQCTIPESYVIAMAARPAAPVWINLDYLSAENWIEGCHKLPSPHPRLPLTKYFYFPGFDPASGGLLREHRLGTQRATFLGNRAGMTEFWHRHGLEPPTPDELRVSLFCYPSAPAVELYAIWARGSTRITALMPEGDAADGLRARLAVEPDARGWIEYGNARLKIIPFTDQVDYDRLLWACDVNFVRGEDSFVRAQWAVRPFVWNVYPQGENAHWIKMHAFLDRYTRGLDASSEAAVRHLWRAWNGIVRPADFQHAWEVFLARRQELVRHATSWGMRLAGHEELAAGLVKFCADIGKCRVTQEPGTSPDRLTSLPPRGSQ